MHRSVQVKQPPSTSPRPQVDTSPKSRPSVAQGPPRQSPKMRAESRASAKSGRQLRNSCRQLAQGAETWPRFRRNFANRWPHLPHLGKFFQILVELGQQLPTPANMRPKLAKLGARILGEHWAHRCVFRAKAVFGRPGAQTSGASRRLASVTPTFVQIRAPSMD